MAKHVFKILRCENRKILKVCLVIFQHYEIKGWLNLSSGRKWGMNHQMRLFALKWARVLDFDTL